MKKRYLGLCLLALLFTFLSTSISNETHNVYETHNLRPLEDEDPGFLHTPKKSG